MLLQKTCEKIFLKKCVTIKIKKNIPAKIVQPEEPLGDDDSSPLLIGGLP